MPNLPGRAAGTSWKSGCRAIFSRVKRRIPLRPNSSHFHCAFPTTNNPTSTRSPAFATSLTTPTLRVRRPCPTIGHWLDTGNPFRQTSHISANVRPARCRHTWTLSRIGRPKPPNEEHPMRRGGLLWQLGEDGDDSRPVRAPFRALPKLPKASVDLT